MLCVNVIIITNNNLVRENGKEDENEANERRTSAIWRALQGSWHEGQRRFMDIIRKKAVKRTGGRVEKIHIVDESIFDERGTESGECLTRTMIKKAFRVVKDE